MRLSRKPGDLEQTAGWFDRGRIMVLINRGDYWQAAVVIAKGGIDAVRAAGLDAFRAEIAGIAPVPRQSDRVGEAATAGRHQAPHGEGRPAAVWHRPGLLCIGDSAHAMSPVGGVGINLAIQDAVAAANLLAEPLAAGRVTEADLAKVRSRRNFPTRWTQWLQVQVQNRVLSRVLQSARPLSLPWPLRVVRRLPILTRIPARIVGLGFRPEHVRIGEQVGQ